MKDPEESQRRLVKEAMKEAIKEWLDERFQLFGKWSLSALLAAFFGAIVYFILWSEGWTKHTQLSLPPR